MKTDTNHNPVVRAILMVALGVVACCTGATATMQYSIVDLGTMGRTESCASAINNAGQVAGYVGSSLAANGHAFLWDGGVMHDLGTLGGSYSYPRDINESGWIVGNSATNGSSYPRPFLWRNGSMSEITGPMFSAHAINDAGQIAGNSLTGGPRDMRAALWDNGVTTILSKLAGTDEADAYGVGDGGQIVGYCYSTETYSHACLWDHGEPQDIGVEGYLYCINQGGLAGGALRGPHPNESAFMWANGVVTDLFVPDSMSSGVLGVNNSGQAVGYANIPIIPPRVYEDRAFLWYDGMKLNLNDLIPADSGWCLVRATGINDSGQIVGYGIYGEQSRAFLLNPVPEPGTLCLVVCGLGALALARRRRP